MLAVLTADHKKDGCYFIGYPSFIFTFFRYKNRLFSVFLFTFREERFILYVGKIKNKIKEGTKA